MHGQQTHTEQGRAVSKNNSLTCGVKIEEFINEFLFVSTSLCDETGCIFARKPMDRRIDSALQSLRARGFVKPCGVFSCRQCNPKHYAEPPPAQTKTLKPSRFTRIEPYPSECVSRRVAQLSGAKAKNVNRFVLTSRLKKQPNAFHYFAAYKPRGVTSMRKLGGGGFGRECRNFADGNCAFGNQCRFVHPGTFQVTTVYHTLPLNWPPVPHVGRLDVATEGLLLFTDDGKLQSALLEKPPSAAGTKAAQNTVPEIGRANVRKSYIVDVYVLDDTSLGAKTGSSDIVVSPERLALLQAPLVYEDDGVVTTPAEVQVLDQKRLQSMLRCIPPQCRQMPENVAPPKSSNTQWIKITISEGRNRQVRRLCAKAGLEVHRLIRWAFGPLSLQNLRGSTARQLSQGQVHSCYRCAALRLTDTPEVLPLDKPIGLQRTPKAKSTTTAGKGIAGGAQKKKRRGKRGGASRSKRAKRQADVAAAQAKPVGQSEGITT